MANITGLTIEDRIELGTYYGSGVYTLYAFCTPAGAEQNVTVTVQNSNPGMFTLARTTAITVGDNFTISGHSGETCVMANLYFNSAVTGNSIISFTDNNAGLVAQKTIYNNPVDVSPNIYISPSSITLSAETFVDNGRTGGPYKLKLGDVVSTGCVYDCPTPSNAYLNQKGPNNDSWENGRPSVGVDGDEYYVYLINQNSGETRWYRHEIYLQDTSGDIYINGFNNFVLYQEGSGSTSGDTSGSTSGDTSGSTSGDTSGYTPATGSCIEVTYDTNEYNGYTISSWPSGTKILGGSGAVQSNYAAMIDTSWIGSAELVDGTAISRSQFNTGFYDTTAETFTIRYYPNGTAKDPTYQIPVLPQYSFYDCGRVVSVKLIYDDPAYDIVQFDGRAFQKTSLACITLPEGFRRFNGWGVFLESDLECITIPASMTEPVSQVLPNNMGNNTFDDSNVTKIFAKGTTAPQIASNTFSGMTTGGTLYYPVGSDYSTWLDALPQNWTWAIYDPYAVDTCDCAHDGENVPIIESGTTNPPSGTPYISLSGYSNNYLAATGSCVSLPIIATNCTYSSFTATIDYNPNLTAHSVASVTEENGSLKLCLTSNPLTGDAQVAIITVTLYDTNGNSYLHYLGLNQYGNTGPQPPIPSGQTIDSGSTSHTITYSGCPLVFDHSASTGTWNTLPTVTTGGTTDDWWITYDVPANDTDSARTITYYYLRYSGETCEDLVDTVSYTISQAAGSGTPTPSDRWIYLNPSGKTYAVGDAYSDSFFIESSGCSIDSAYTPTCTFSGDTSWISTIENIRWLSYQNAFIVVYPVTRNLTTNNREVYITVNGVHDTDGNVYNGLVFHATQGWGDYVFLNYNETNPSSAGTTDTVEVVPVNTTICSVAVESAYTYTPEFWDGEQPTITLLGNYMTVVWPENPYASLRGYDIDLRVVWGENCENSTVLHYNKYQDAATAPVQKDIKAADTDYSVGSGTGNASTTVQVSGCTYDHFTYITGGSFSVTATSGPNNTIVFTYPENTTTSPRTGYVYITFYDSDGNAYGPQTITFTQQAGSSPGPGPGPDPSTGYVLTTLTISDQEQHRYFVEARPGVVYSAAGQYYKTILACEARYSLYYVNSYGGVDVLPFKGGGQKKTDNITRFNYSRSFRNNTPEFENVNYMNEIKEEYELHTGWMSDEQSMRMHELVESTIVYLYDAEEKTYTPVVMTDKKLEYKTYRNQGRKFYNYTVNVEESQSKERR